MLTTSSFNDLLYAKKAFDELEATEPGIYQKFINIIQLTRQLQFRSQYMGALIMDEAPGKYRPEVHNDYVLNVYQQEVENLKTDQHAADLKQLLTTYKQIGYANISRLVLGKSPSFLVGPRMDR